MKKLSMLLLVVSLSMVAIYPLSVGSTEIILNPYDRASRITKIALEHTPIKAQGVFVGVLDESSNEIQEWYSNNADVPYNIASVTKLATVMTALETVDPTTVVSADRIPKLPRPLGDFPIMSTTIDTLVRAALMQSSNTATYVLAEQAKGNVTTFVEEMNNSAQSMGLSSAHFSDPSGYDFGTHDRASVMTPRDVALLAMRFYQKYPEYAAASVAQNMQVPSIDNTKKIYSFVNTNKLAAVQPEARLSKTGFTLQAGGNLVMVYELTTGEKVAVVILNSTVSDRFSDMRRIWSVVRTAIQSSHFVVDNRYAVVH